MALTTREAKYLGRQGLVRVKQLLGLSRRGDKTFFIERLSRLLRSGSVGRNISVMATGKGDGAGSQALGLMSAINFARAHGIGYVHVPLQNVEHPEPGISDWSERWERYFNLGQGEVAAPDCAARIVTIEQFLSQPKLWNSDAVVSAEHFLHFANLEPSSWSQSQLDFQAKFPGYREKPDGEPLIIAAHVRRGDVSRSNAKTANSFTGDESFLTAIKLAKAHFERLGCTVGVEVHSQGEKNSFQEYEELGASLLLNRPAMESHQRLANADMLIMSQSSFSYTAGLLNRSAVIYDPQKYRPVPEWIVRDQNGSFDTSLF